MRGVGTGCDRQVFAMEINSVKMSHLFRRVGGVGVDGQADRVRPQWRSMPLAG